MTYREQFPDSKQLAEAIRLQTRTDILSLMKGIAVELLEESGGDMHATYEYFSPVYDELYHSIIFKKLQIQEETKELLEILATPLFRKTPAEQQQIFQDYIL